MDRPRRRHDAADVPEPPTVYATRGLLGALLALAADADPDPVTVALATTPAADLDFDEAAADAGTDVPEPETPVYAEFYLPDAGDSIRAVFGVDLGVPAGQTAGRFLSHPTGELDVSSADDFHARMLVAVPPWTPGEVAAFDRRGRRLPLAVVDAEPPERRLD